MKKKSRPASKFCAALLLAILSGVLTTCLDIDLADELNWPDGRPPGTEAESPVDGGPIGPSSVNSDTGALDEATLRDAIANDTEPPWLIPAPGCAATEQLLSNNFCVSTGPRGIALRFWASEPVTSSARIEPDEEITGSETLATEHHLIISPLPAETEFAIHIEITDMADHLAAEGPLSLMTSPAVVPVVINEVLYDPLGEEPDQEFVELYNWGEEEVSLEGWTIADEGGEDAFPTTTILPPGGFALIIAGAYQPGAGSDPPPAPDTVMIRLEGPIGSSGIRNSGETLLLRDGAGAIISSFPNILEPPGPGLSVERLESLGPDGDPGNWHPNFGGSSSPGSTNSEPQSQ